MKVNFKDTNSVQKAERAIAARLEIWKTAKFFGAHPKQRVLAPLQDAGGAAGGRRPRPEAEL